MAQRDPSQAAHEPSYLRHWRKGVVLARHFLAHDNLWSRIHLVGYELLVANPAQVADDIGQFLGVDNPSSMLTLTGTGPHHRGAVGGKQPQLGAMVSMERWGTVLSPTQVSAVEYMCGPEMRTAGYAVVRRRCR